MSNFPILIIDDNEFICASMIKFLESNRYKAVGVSSAMSAMEILKKQQFSLIITDILMPDIDGFELIDFIRNADEPTKSTPIIAISGGGGSIDANMVLNSLEDKVDCVLKKPFSKKDLLQKTADFISKREKPSSADAKI